MRRFALVAFALLSASGSSIAFGQAGAGIQNVALLTASIRDATLGAINQVPSGGKVEDYEGAILFAIDKISAPWDVVDAGLGQAEVGLADGPAKTAIENIRRMRVRVSGTGSIPTGVGTVLLGPGIGGGGGGGTSNYSN